MTILDLAMAETRWCGTGWEKWEGRKIARQALNQIAVLRLPNLFKVALTNITKTPLIFMHLLSLTSNPSILVVPNLLLWMTLLGKSSQFPQDLPRF